MSSQRRNRRIQNRSGLGQGKQNKGRRKQLKAKSFLKSKQLETANLNSERISSKINNR